MLREKRRKENFLDLLLQISYQEKNNLVCSRLNDLIIFFPPKKIMFKENKKLFVGKVDMSRQWIEGGILKELRLQ